MNDLGLTGERTVPGIWHENYWFRRHEAAYEFLLPYARVRTVLDVGCGEGYGAARFAEVASRVIGLDYDAATVGHATTRYPIVAAGVARWPPGMTMLNGQRRVGLLAGGPRRPAGPHAPTDSAWARSQRRGSRR